MKLLRLAVSHYKNLVTCEVRPNGLHALTGCNSAGKSNFLEIIDVLQLFMAGSDEDRQHFMEGWPAHGFDWFPFAISPEHIQPLVIQVELQIAHRQIDWVVSYVLKLHAPEKAETPYSREGVSQISEETVHMKRLGRPGRATLILRREKDGKTNAVPEQQKRRRLTFESKAHMSAIQALEIREAGNFTKSFPVLADFRSQLLASSLIRMNPGAAFSRDEPADPALRTQSRNALFEMLQDIKQRPADWTELMQWLEELCGITNVDFEEKTETVEKDSIAKRTRRFIMFKHGSFLLLPEELSTGTAMLVTLILNVMDRRRKSGAILIEEPELCLHPGALVMLMRLLREFSRFTTILFSTHSPVALNSMNPNEVTLLTPTGDGFFTTTLVSAIQEATDTLNRGFVSFGDLLQTNFATAPATN